MSFFIPNPPLPRTPAQVAAIDGIGRAYPPPFVVGWHCTDTGKVRGSVYRSVADDEAGRECGGFTVYDDGMVTWWKRP